MAAGKDAAGGRTAEDVMEQDAQEEGDVNLSERISPERAISLVGLGPFQRWLTALCMLGNAADAVEVLSVGLILPTVGREFCLSDAQKGLLTSSIFAGGLVGCLTWGIVGDRFGRASIVCAPFHSHSCNHQTKAIAT
jgi:hypothetical protein